VFIGRILFVEGALSRSDKATKIRNELTTRRTAIEPILRERIERARVEGDESVEGVPQKVARYISTVVQGMAVQAAGGSTREELHEIVDVVLSGMSRSRQPRTGTGE
jgi:hypothetical protein